MKALNWNWKRWPFAVAAFLMAALPVAAHEKWFVDEHLYRGPVPEVFLQPTIFGVTALIVAFLLFLALALVDRMHEGTVMARWFDKRFEALRTHPKTILGISLGVSLMGAGLQHTLFVPNLELPLGAFGSTLAIIEIFIGLGLIFLEEWYAELGAAMALLWFASFSFGLPAEEMIEELMMLGAGIYLMAGERTRMPWARWNTEDVRRRGYQIFRVCAGISFLALSMVKWLRPDLATFLVGQFHINFLAPLGASDGQFVFLAAIVETFIALCILFRVAFRLACAIAFSFFLLTIFVFGFGELLGHLPIKAALFVFFVNGHWHKGEKKPLG